MSHAYAAPNNDVVQTYTKFRSLVINDKVGALLSFNNSGIG